MRARGGSSPSQVCPVNDMAVYAVEKMSRRRSRGFAPEKPEKRYVFDAAFDGMATNEQIYMRTVQPLVRVRGTLPPFLTSSLTTHHP